MMECTNLLAEATSSLKSRCVLRLVSTARAMLSGSSDSWPNTRMFCKKPSSNTLKSSLVRPATGAPCSSVTVAKTLTKRTFTRNVASGFCDFCVSPPDGAATCACAARHSTSRQQLKLHCPPARACFIKLFFRYSALLRCKPQPKVIWRHEFLRETVHHRPKPRRLRSILSSRWELSFSEYRSTSGRPQRPPRDAPPPLQPARWFPQFPGAQAGAQGERRARENAQVTLEPVCAFRQE